MGYCGCLDFVIVDLWSDILWSVDDQVDFVVQNCFDVGLCVCFMVILFCERGCWNVVVLQHFCGVFGCDDFEFEVDELFDRKDQCLFVTVGDVDENVVFDGQ